MAYYDEPIVDPDGFAAEQALLDQQAARIKALRQNYAKPYEFNPQEVGGFTLSTGQRIPGRVVSGGWGQALQALTPLVADYTAGRQEKELAAGIGALDTRQRKAALDWAANIPQDTPYSAVPTNAPSATNPGGNFVEAAVTEAKPADRALVLKHAMAGINNKYSAKAAEKLFDAEAVDVPKEQRTQAFQTAQKTNELNAHFIIEQEKAKAAAAQHAATNATTIRAAEIAAASRQASAAASAANKGTPQWVRNDPDPANPGKQIGIYYNPSTQVTTQGPAKEKDFVPNATQQAKNVELVAAAEGFKNLRDTYKPEYSRSVIGSLDNTEVGKMFGTEGSKWWMDANAAQTKIRHGYFGSALTPTEKGSFTKISFDSSTNPEVTQAYLADAAAMAEVAAARKIALTENKGARMDPKTGEIILSDGSRVEGTATPQFAIVGKEKTEEAPKQAGRGRLTSSPAAAPAAAPAAVEPPPNNTPPGVGANGKTSLQVNQEAFVAAQSAYRRDPSEKNRQALDLARADLDRAKASSDTAAPPPAPLAKSKSKAEVYNRYGVK